jgi:hypothetical protein
MFVICQLKFEHLKMRKPMALPINVLCDVCDWIIKHLQGLKLNCLISIFTTDLSYMTLRKKCTI